MNRTADPDDIAGMGEPARTPRYPGLECVETLTAERFRGGYLGRRPFVWRGALAASPAIRRWSFDYLRRHAGDRPVKIKERSHLGGTPVSRTTLRRFLDRLDEEADRGPALPYLHDTLLLERGSRLLRDLGEIPAGLLPPWYRSDWWRFALFFVGAPGSLTPLHCDSLLTHNLFFQLRGRKRFIVVPPEHGACCYARDWRWSRVDAERPDLARFPRFGEARPRECTLGPGDLLYLPPRSYHQVRGYDRTVSFNLDWHTRRSAWRGVAAGRHGMPASAVWTNAIHAVGLTTGLPARAVMPLLARHFRRVD